ncbi:MAG: hypothetical protein LBK68_05915 [Candidatus Margulisbacteria bacterium]|jgi:hypothetical protein|nr:hypothetical protein [Candidatus Margulisiibacteriota bacterium]
MQIAVKEKIKPIRNVATSHLLGDKADQQLLYHLRQYMKNAEDREYKPGIKSPKDFPLTDEVGELIKNEAGKVKTIRVKRLADRLNRIKNKKEEELTETQKEIRRSWDSLKDNRNDWSDTDILYYLRQYMKNAEDKEYQPKMTSNKSFPLTDERGYLIKDKTGKMKTIKVKDLSQRIGRFKYKIKHKKEGKLDETQKEIERLLNSLKYNQDEDWVDAEILYYLQQYMKNTEDREYKPKSKSPDSFQLTDERGNPIIDNETGKAKAMNIGNLTQRIRIFNRRIKNESNKEELNETQKEIKRLWDSLKENIDYWSDADTLYYLQQYMKNAEKKEYKPSIINPESFPLTDESGALKVDEETGAVKTIKVKRLAEKISRFKDNIKNKKEDELDETQREIKKLYDDLKNNTDYWPDSNVLYYLQQYINNSENKEYKPSTISPETLSFLDETGIKRTIKVKRLSQRIRDLIEKDELTDTQKEIKRLWDSLKNNRRDKTDDNLLYYLQQYTKNANDRKYKPVITQNNKSFPFMNDLGKPIKDETGKTQTMKVYVLAMKLVHFKDRIRDIESLNETQREIIRLLDSLKDNKKGAKSAGETSNSGTIFPAVYKPTGEEHTDGLSNTRVIIDYSSPAKRGIVFLRGGRLVDLTDHTNIYDRAQFGPDNSPRHEHIEIPAPSVSRSDIEHGLYVFTRRLYDDLTGMTDFSSVISGWNKMYSDPQKINENPDLHTLAEAEDSLLRLAEMPLFTVEEKDALLSAYDAACVEVANAEELADDPQNWPRCVELSALYDRLTLKYNAALFNAYLQILKDRSAELDKLLQYVGGRIETNRLAGASVLAAAEQARRIYFWLELIRNGVLDSAERYAEYYKQYRQEATQYNAELPMADVRGIIRANLPARRERVIRLIRRDLLSLGNEAQDFREHITHATEQLAIAKTASGQNANIATDDMTSSTIDQ